MDKVKLILNEKNSGKLTGISSRLLVDIKTYEQRKEYINTDFSEGMIVAQETTTSTASVC